MRLYNVKNFTGESAICVSSVKFKIIFSLQLGLATVWALGNYSIKLFWICDICDAVFTFYKHLI